MYGFFQPLIHVKKDSSQIGPKLNEHRTIYDAGKGDTMTITFRVSDEEGNLIRRYAKTQNKSISEAVRTVIIAKIEDEMDLAIYFKTMAEHIRNPHVRRFDEVWNELNHLA